MVIISYTNLMQAFYHSPQDRTAIRHGGKLTYLVGWPKAYRDDVTYAAQDAHGHADVVSNVWKTNPWPLKAPRIAYTRARSSQCFDIECAPQGSGTCPIP